MADASAPAAASAVETTVDASQHQHIAELLGEWQQPDEPAADSQGEETPTPDAPEPPTDPTPPEAEGEEADETPTWAKHLLARIEAIEGKKAEQPISTEEPLQPVQIDLDKLFEDEDAYRNVFSNKESFTGFLKTFAATIQEGLLTRIPDIVQNTRVRQERTAQQATKFFEENSDLLGVRGYVAQVVTEISGSNPDWPVEKVLAEAAQRTRTALGIQKKAQQTEASKGKAGAGSRTPLAPPPRSGAPGRQAASSTKDEPNRALIDELINAAL